MSVIAKNDNTRLFLLFIILSRISSNFNFLFSRKPSFSPKNFQDIIDIHADITGSGIILLINQHCLQFYHRTQGVKSPGNAKSLDKAARQKCSHGVFLTKMHHCIRCGKMRCRRRQLSCEILLIDFVHGRIGWIVNQRLIFHPFLSNNFQWR